MAEPPFRYHSLGPTPLLVRLVNSLDATPEQIARAFPVQVINDEPPSNGGDGMPPNATPFRFCVSGSVPAGSTLSFNSITPYSPGAWPFPHIVPANTQYFVTELQFASKKVRHPQDPGNMRSSYAVFNNIMTMTEHMPFCSYRVPIRLPEGFNITGQWMNNSNELQNMIASLHGYALPLET